MLAWVLVAALGPAGCASRAGDAIGGGAVDEEAVTRLGPLAGRTFVAVEFQGYLDIVGEPFRLSFLNGGLQASAGCTQMSGPVDPSGGVLSPSLSISPTVQCGPLMADQGTWVPELLSGRPAWTLSGSDLTVSGAAGSVTFTEVTAQVPGVSDIGWRLTAIIGAGAVTDVPPETDAWMVLQNGMLTISTGPLRGSNPFRMIDDRIVPGSFSLGGSTFRAGESSPVDDTMAVVLLATPTVEVEENRLTLTAADGSPSLQFDRDPTVLQAMSDPAPPPAPATSPGGSDPTATTTS